MNLGFSDEHEAMRAEFRKLVQASPPRAAFEAFDAARDGSGIVDAALWQQLAELGWLATAIPEAHGGSGLPPPLLCLLAEEAGRGLAAVPFTTSACAFTYALLGLSKHSAVPPLLAQLADGSARGVLLGDECWPLPARCDDAGTLIGRVHNVLDGAAATHALAWVGADRSTNPTVDPDGMLVLLDLQGATRIQAGSPVLDLLHPCQDLVFDRHPGTVLARGAAGLAQWEQIVNAHALFVAFEQLGGAQSALEAARAYSLQRFAFGRAIGSFQALKHMMADMLVAIDLARSNCYFGAAALAAGGDQLAEAAAVARISATEAFRTCAVGSTQVHGALGVTWEADCHLHYRRAQALAAGPGSLRGWKERLVALLRRRAADTAITTPALRAADTLAAT